MQIFPDAKHRLCLWHLLKNAVSRFGSLKSNVGFKEAFHKCLMGCNSEEEFNECWDNMVTMYNMKDNEEFYKWFDRLHKIRHKWCTGLSKDFFSAGILSSQRSESTNSAIGFEATKTTSLTQFYKIFQNTVERWRKREIEAEFYCSRTTPSSSLRIVGLLKHAAEVYTASLFRDFEEEFKIAISCYVTEVTHDNGLQVYK